MKPVDLFPFPEKEETKVFESDSRIRVDIFGNETSHGGMQVSVEYSKLTVEPKDMVFSIMPGTFYDCVIPETVSSLWGPIPLERLPEGVYNSCR